MHSSKLYINFLSSQIKTFRLLAVPQIQVIDTADMYKDNIKGRKWKPCFQVLITVMLINGFFFLLFCLHSQADTVTDAMWGKKRGSMGSKGATCTYKAMRKTLHENHCICRVLNLMSGISMVKELFCGSQCFEPIGKLAIF